MWWKLCKLSDSEGRKVFNNEWDKFMDYFNTFLNQSYKKVFIGKYFCINQFIVLINIHVIFFLYITGKIHDVKLWLINLFDRREKWAACYTWQHLTYGIHSTQRSEAINSSIAQWCRKTSILTELYNKLAYLAQTQAINSDSRYVRELWKKSVRTTVEEFAILRDIEKMVTPKAFELMKSQASLFPKYHISPYDMVKDGYYVMHDSKKVAHSSAVNAIDDHESVNITYLTKAKKDEIACLDKGISEFTTVSFVESSLKTCTCQYSRNYGLPCRHQFAVAYFCGLKSFTIDFVDEFWWKVDDAENKLLANNNNSCNDSMKGTTIAISNNDRFEFLKKMCLPACEVASQKMSLFYSLSTTIDNWTKIHCTASNDLDFKNNLTPNPNLPNSFGNQKRKRPLFGPTSATSKKKSYS